MSVYLRGSVYWTKFNKAGQRFSYSTQETDRYKALERADEIKETVLGSLTEVEISDHYNPFSMGQIQILSEATKRMFLEKWEGQKDASLTMSRMKTLIGILGDPLVTKITSNKISQAQMVLLRDGRSKATVNRYMSHLKTVLNACYRKWETIDRVPYIEHYKESPGRLRVFTEQETMEIIRHLSGDPSSLRRNVGDMVVLSLSTGCRVGELIQLTWKDNIDLEKRWIRLFPDQTKSSKPRTIPLNDAAFRVLQKCLPGNPQGGPWLHIRKDYVSTAFRFLRKKMEIQGDPEFLFHTCRHTFASRLVNKGIPLATIRDLLGHSSIHVTERYAKTTALANLMDAVNVL